MTHVASMDDSTSSQYSDKARDSLRDLMELQVNIVQWIIVNLILCVVFVV